MKTQPYPPNPICEFLPPFLLALMLGSGTARAVSIPLHTFPATGNGLEQPVAVALDPSGGASSVGAVVVTGISHALGQASNFVTAKYEGGSLRWTRTYNGPASSFDQPRAMVLDAAGNIYVTGTSRGSHGNDYATVKYSPAGVELWVARYDAEVDDVPTAICVGADGAVYVTGYSNGEEFIPEGITTIKYSATGAQLAVFHLPEAEAGAFDADGPAAIAADAAGNLLLAGASAGLQEQFDLLVVRLDAAGQVLGRSRVSGPPQFQLFPHSLAQAADGSFAVLSTGEQEATGEADAFVTRFNATGQRQWSGRMGKDVAATGVRFDALGNVIAVGTADEKELLTLKFSPNGTLLSQTTEPLGNAVALAAGATSDEIISATLQPQAAGGVNIATFRTPVVTSTSLPLITTAPEGHALMPGVDRPLVVQATGAATYQWFRDGTPIIGATAAAYLPGSLAGDYTVEVGNSFGSVLSPLATVSAEDVIFGFGFRTDGIFRALFSGETGRIYEFQTSGDLSRWNTFSTQRYTGTPVEFTDRPATGVTSRYYRARRFL